MIKGVQVSLPMKLILYPVKNYTFYTCSTTYKKQGAPDQRSLTQQKFMLFTHVAPRTKSKGLPINIPYLAKTYAFYTRSTTYKMQGAPDRRSLTQQKTYAFYICSIAYKKEGGSWSMFCTSSVTFSMCFTTYKKSGAP
jgi:hypothetical protein